MTLDLDALPLSAAAAHWLEGQTDRGAALVRLATGGDDYEVVCAVSGDPPEGFTVIGKVAAGAGVKVRLAGRAIEIARTGWTHL